MLTEERKQKITEMVEKDGIVKITELADLFNVSIFTIRRDLADLEKKGILKKTHGGAVKVEKAIWLPTPDEGQNEASLEKEAIAKMAANYIEDGDAIFLIGSTITNMMIPYISSKKISVITNSLDVGKALCNYDNMEIIIIGGKIKNFKGNILGSRAAHEVENYYFDKSFIPCGGIQSKAGVTTSTIDTADFMRAVIKSTNENILVADYRKIGRVTFSKVCDFNNIRRLITDDKADKMELEEISKKGVMVNISKLNE